MIRPAASALQMLALVMGLVTASVQADPVIPGNIMNPQSAAEAWNAIRLATANVDRLIQEKRFSEITVQIAYCSPALRAMPRLVTNADAVVKVSEQSARALTQVNTIAKAATDNNPAGTEAAFSNLKLQLDELAKHFDAKTVRAEIFFCPMHPDFSSEGEKTPCAKCGMNLLTRRIPYSFVYMKPGEPTMRMTAKIGAPIEAGKKIEVRIKLAKGDGSPVLHDDLMVMHTQPIHLLIEDPSLGDYHHEHPVVTDTPGEYAFSFTPSKSAPYRIWADLVPVSTGVQELPFTDLPSNGTPAEITDKADRFTSTVEGFTFALTLAQGSSPLVANQARRLDIAVSDREGKPVTHLEPVMNAFAHLVGFYDDYKTVVHIHPMGGDVTDDALRGGPALSFMSFPPRAGFIRLYCQVLVDGKMLFAPFNVNVE
jgi:hypothetical protein